MWSTRLAVVIGLVALALSANGQQAGTNYEYEPPQGRDGSSRYLPPDNKYLPAEEERNLLGDANEGSQQVIGLEQPKRDDEEHHHHHHDGDHHDHHEHWDLRESIPGEPGEDYPLHHSPPETGFSCQGRIVGYYADIQAGCQAFHVCNGDDSPPQSFLCPNGTIFNQEVFSCEWWNNVDCAASETHYAKNSEIGVVIPYKGERTPLLKVQSNAEGGDNDINFQSASSNEDENRLYLPPVDTPPPTTTRRPTTERPTAPPSTYLPPQRQRTTARPTPPPPAPTAFRPIVVADFPSNDLQTPLQSDLNNNFQGYDYPKPTTTQRPIASGPSNNLPSFSEADGYDYPKPAVGLPETTRRPQTTTTRRPVTTTRRPVTTTQRPVTTTRRPVTTTTRRPIVVSSTTGRPIVPGQSNPLPSFSENDGYSYPKPSVGLPLPTTTRQPVTTTRRPAPTTTRRPVTTTTRQPIIQSTTQRPIAPGPSNQLPSFSEADGYDYPKPSVGLPVPTTTRRPAIPSTTTRRPIPTTTTTRRPVTTTRRPVTTTQRPFVAGPSNPLPSFNENDGYDYPKPSVGLPVPTTTRRPQTSARPIPTTTRAPQTTRQPFIQSTTQQPIASGPSNQNEAVEGYSYPKPAVPFPTPSRPVPTTTRRPVSITQRPPTTTFRPVTTTFRPVTTTSRPVTTTLRPVPTQGPAASNNGESGYSYPKPSVAFPLPSTTREPQTTRQPFVSSTQSIQFGAGGNEFSFASTSTTRPAAPSSVAPVESTSGYNYPKPSIPFELPQTPEPQPQPSSEESEGYNYPKPGSPFSVFQRNPQNSDTSANLINQAYQSAPPCIHNQPQQAQLVPSPNAAISQEYLPQAPLDPSPNSAISQEYLPQSVPLDPIPNNAASQEYLPPAQVNNVSPSSVSAAPTINLDLSGYDYQKPTIGFVTGTKKPFKNEVLAPFNPEEVLSSNQELSAVQDHAISTQYTQPFIDGYHAVQQGSSASSFRQESAQQTFSSHSSGGYVESQRSHLAGSHVLEIIPSISYSYQIENKQEGTQQSFQPAAAPATFKRSKNHAMY